MSSHPGRSSAALWLDELCLENINLLQKSVPLPHVEHATDSNETFPVLDSLWWGISAMQLEEANDIHCLAGLIHNVKRSRNQEFVQGIKADTASSPHDIAIWLSKQLPVRSNEPGVALVSAGWIHGLPELGRELDPSVWLETLQTILTQVDRAWVSADPETLLPWLIWACDIPLALAKQLSHLGSKDRIVCETLDRLALALEQAQEVPNRWLDDGCRQLRSLLACVVRCRSTADQLGARSWFAPQRKSLAWLASMAVAASDRDGKPLLVDSRIGEQDLNLWMALDKIVGTTCSLHRLLETCIPEFPSPSKPSKSKRSFSHLTLGLYNEKAEVALMRRSWSNHGCRVAVDFSTAPMWLDVIGRGGQRLFSGHWEVQVNKDGRDLEIDYGWSEVCWFSDDEVDYLELQCEIDNECTLQRQVMLVRDEGLVFAADALVGLSDANWEIESRYPLENGVTFAQEAKTHEGYLTLDLAELAEREALVLPIGLPEWKRQPGLGQISEESDCLVLTQATTGKFLYSPIVFSLRKRNLDEAYTWRHLTVAEDLQIVSKDDAAAFRVQIGKSQWMIYRSMARTKRRTAMGLHMNVEFYAGRFDGNDGQFDALVEVDAESE